MEPLSGQKQSGESQKAITACNDWLRLGPGRTIPKLLEKYNDIQQNAVTKSLSTLHAWSFRYDWAMRAEAYDAEIERQKNERRQQVMETGFALDYERVDTLKGLAHLLVEQIYERGEDDQLHNVWVPDVKQIGSGEFAERVDIERYNAAIIDNLRGVLDDLAKETGGRTQKIDANVNVDGRLVIMPPQNE